jgi:hypothetical protein
MFRPQSAILRCKKLFIKKTAAILGTHAPSPSVFRLPNTFWCSCALVTLLSPPQDSRISPKYVVFLKIFIK